MRVRVHGPGVTVVQQQNQVRQQESRSRRQRARDNPCVTLSIVVSLTQ